MTSYTRQYLDKEGGLINTECYARLMTSWDLLYNILRMNFGGHLFAEGRLYSRETYAKMVVGKREAPNRARSDVL